MKRRAGPSPRLLRAALWSCVTACAASCSNPTQPACTPGKVSLCECSPGLGGASTCGANGVRGACQCGLQDGGVTDVDVASDVVDDGDATPVADVPTVNPNSVVQLSQLRQQTCVRRAGGSVECWGMTPSGFVSSRSRSIVPGLSDAVEIAISDDVSCARRSSAGVVCWGRAGLVGDGSLVGAADRRSPVAVVGLTAAAAISAGARHACALVPSGEVVCWGENNSGCLGDGTFAITRTTPVTVVGLSDAVEIAAGGGQTCARRRTGSVVCWGDLPLFSMRSLTPTPVPDLTDAVEIGSGFAHSCARRSSGAVVCWGFNEDGQVGDGTTLNRLTPTAVAGLSDAVEISLGWQHTCARRSSGAVVCWGRNEYGQLGDGTFGVGNNRYTPVAVVGLDVAVEISTGMWTSCARRSTGGVVCWGVDHGDGSMATPRPMPFPIEGL